MIGRQKIGVKCHTTIFYPTPRELSLPGTAVGSASKAQFGCTKAILLIHEAQQGCRDATYEPSRFPVAVPYPSPHRATPAYVVVTSSDLDTSRNKASVSGLLWISRKAIGQRFIRRHLGYARCWHHFVRCCLHGVSREIGVAGTGYRYHIAPVNLDPSRSCAREVAARSLPPFALEGHSSTFRTPLSLVPYGSVGIGRRSFFAILNSRTDTGLPAMSYWL